MIYSLSFGEGWGEVRGFDKLPMTSILIMIN